MKRVAQFILVLIVLTVATGPELLLAQDRRLDGNWWQSHDHLTKTVFVVGFSQGMVLGRNFSYWKFMNDRARQICLNAVVESFDEFQSKFMEKVTGGQLTDGLNSFYQDYRNRRIMVYDAAWLVLNEITGTPREKLDSMIEGFRRNPGS